MFISQKNNSNKDIIIKEIKQNLDGLDSNEQSLSNPNSTIDSSDEPIQIKKVETPFIEDQPSYIVEIPTNDTAPDITDVTTNIITNDHLPPLSKKKKKRLTVSYFKKNKKEKL